MTNGNIVEFETVHRRFGEAVEALTQLSKLMGGLRETEKVKERTAVAMTDASDRLRETSAAIASYCELLRSALDSTLQALQSAENLATGAELAAIRTEVASNRAALTDLAGGQSTIAETVENVRNKIADDLSQAQVSRENALSELTVAKSRLDMLEGRLSGLPPKVRRKYDLEDL